jgi:euchromatic histone-lysine N-methyltransferase
MVTKNSMTYVCGPDCNCCSSCHNRVSQNEIKFMLDIFKTKIKGLGCEITC